MVEPAKTVFRLQNFCLEMANVAMQPPPAALLVPAGGGPRIARVTGEEMNILLRHAVSDEEIDDGAKRASGKTRPFVGYGKSRRVGLFEKRNYYGRIHQHL